MIEKIEQEIKSSKENFFKVKIVKDSDKPKKMLKSENLKHATKNKNHAHLVIKEGYLEKKYDSNIFFKWTVRDLGNSEKILRVELGQAVLLRRPQQGEAGGLHQLQKAARPAEQPRGPGDRDRFL